MLEPKEILIKTGQLSGTDTSLLIGEISIDDLLHGKYEKHIGSFEIPFSLKEILTADDVNASVSWYLTWKLREPFETQNTCTIRRLFGEFDGTRVIIAINLYKYLRNKGYDPNIIERFVINTNKDLK